jgi:hypothetical protein
MNRSKRNVYLLAAVLVAAAGCNAREGRGSNASRATITRNWPASGIAMVKVVEVDGNISVEPSTGSEISLLATAEGDLEIKKGEENDGLFETKLIGDTLRIGRTERENDRGFQFFWEVDEVEIDYVLKVPAAISLAVTTVNGKIVTRGIDGDIKATTINGPIEVEAGGTKELTASTINGRVRAKFTRDFQGARFKTINGGVTATLPATASFAVNLSQVNGDFEASFPLSIHSNPGSRRVSGDVNGGNHELKITTVNGDVELAQLGPSGL